MLRTVQHACSNDTHKPVKGTAKNRQVIYWRLYNRQKINTLWEAKKAQADFHLKPAPTERAEVRETGLKEVSRLSEDTDRLQTQLSGMCVFVCAGVCVFITLTP